MGIKRKVPPLLSGPHSKNLISRNARRRRALALDLSCSAQLGARRRSTDRSLIARRAQRGVVSFRFASLARLWVQPRRVRKNRRFCPMDRRLLLSALFGICLTSGC